MKNFLTPTLLLVVLAVFIYASSYALSLNYTFFGFMLMLGIFLCCIILSRVNSNLVKDFYVKELERRAHVFDKLSDLADSKNELVKNRDNTISRIILASDKEQAELRREIAILERGNNTFHATLMELKDKYNALFTENAVKNATKSTESDDNFPKEEKGTSSDKTSTTTSPSSDDKSNVD